MPFIIECSDIPTVISDEQRFYHFLTDCFAASTNSQRRFLDARLTVDSVDIPIATCEYDDDDNEIGAKLTVALARLSDKAAFTRTASIKFELGEKIAGVWTWKPMFEGARLKALSHELAQRDLTPNDKITIIATPLLQSRLDKTPLGTVVLYDPAKLTLLEADFLSLPDITGVDHAVTLVPVGSLSTWKIFNYIAEQCGFSSSGGYYFKSNVPDFPIRRIDFSAGDPYWNAVAGLIGVFKPQLDIDADDNLVIKEGTADLLPDSSAAVALTVDRLTAAQDSRDIERYKGVLLTYQEQGLGWDYWQETVLHDDHDNALGISTSRETYVRSYYRRSFPHTPVKSQRTIEYKSVYNGALGNIGGQIAASGERLSYTNLGLPSGKEKRVWSKSKAPDTWVTFNGTMPSPGFSTDFIGPEVGFVSSSDATFTNAVVLAKTERESITYLAHPYEADQVYISRRENENRGLITKDTDNPQLDEDFTQPLVTAQRSGNLAAGQGCYWDVLGFNWEEQVPLRNRGVLIRSSKSENLNSDGEALLPDDWEDPRQGDIGISIIQHIQKQVYVFDEADSTATRVLPLNAGEAPIAVARPLAVRYNRAQYYPGNAQMSIPGFDTSLVRGRTVAPSDRAGTTFGTYRITGFTITGGAGKFQTVLRGKQIGSADVVAADSTQVNDVQGTSLESGQQRTITIQVPCWSGSVLSGVAVAGLTVEARHGHSGAFTDIETATIDLTTWDGSTEEFEVRLTAPTVTTPYTRTFTLTAGPDYLAGYGTIFNDSELAVLSDTEHPIYG